MPKIDSHVDAKFNPPKAPDSVKNQYKDLGPNWGMHHRSAHTKKMKGASAEYEFKTIEQAGTDGIIKVHLKSKVGEGFNYCDWEEDIEAHLGIPEYKGELLGDSGPSGGTGGTGGTGETSYIESFKYSPHDDNTIDDKEWTKKTDNEYPSDQPHSVFQARIFREYAIDHQGELITKTHPHCSTRELTPFADATSDPGTKVDVTDTFGGNTTKQIFPSSLFTVLYDLHYTENCEDPFTPDKGRFSLSARTADYSGANTQAVDTSYFSLDPVAKIGVFAIVRRIANRALLKVDEDELSSHGYEAIPVGIKFTQKNKYGQTCSTHGDQIELEVIGKHKHLFEAGFAVVRKIHTKCTDDGRTDIAEEIKRLQAPDTDGDRKSHTHYGKGHTPSEVTDPEGYDYQILFKSPCIKLSDAKTKDCKGNTLIKVYVKHKHGDAGSLAMAFPYKHGDAAALGM